MLTMVLVSCVGSLFVIGIEYSCIEFDFVLRKWTVLLSVANVGELTF
jgi:hypothetical protein